MRAIAKEHQKSLAVEFVCDYRRCIITNMISVASFRVCRIYIKRYDRQQRVQ